LIGTNALNGVVVDYVETIFLETRNGSKNRKKLALHSSMIQEAILENFTQ
jgi:hypothetical protein